MAAGLTYRELVRETRALAKEIRKATDAHRATASRMADEAKDTGRIADQLAHLKVDAATIAETREVARTMQGLSNAAVAYISGCDTASKAAAGAHDAAVTTHGGIQEAVDRSPAPMAKSSFYTQE